MRFLIYLATFLVLFTACSKDKAEPAKTPPVDPNKAVITLRVTSNSTAKDVQVYILPKDGTQNDLFSYEATYNETPQEVTAKQISHRTDATFRIAGSDEFKPVPNSGKVHAELIADGQVISTLDFDTSNPPQDPTTKLYYIQRVVTIP
ncbi:hypothetical protein [Hymenobacter sp. DG25A]|uniref:hypothetical protein n=1 Tax=Hymenobacter sp. DG25A TaxID=1385663 RepID=UPI0006BE0523|nr:hypothetical protein [Hymenobacter sp. DG25A]ALD21496.1 hypothetical protein AM218_10080 [Hymenobacter sp. DG25A]